MVSYTSNPGLKSKLWKEEQRKRISASKNNARIEREELKWERERGRWGHEHPKRGVS